MKCLLKTCSNKIPNSRKKSARYCSDICYYEAKKRRSSQRYSQLKAPADELKRCEGILAYLYGVSQLKKAISANDLQTLGFNFNIAAGEYLDKRTRLFKVIGKYAYYIEANKNLTIWKSK